MSSKKTTPNNILIIGDIHCPFEIDGYLEFCKEQYKHFNCNKVIFIGDIIDNHFASFHTSDPDGYGAGQELERAVDKLSKWYEAFPVADVIIGNHDRLIMRKAFESGIPQIWIKDYKDVLNVPHWNFQHEVEYDNVTYVHGEGSTARTKAKNDSKSVVQGHRHSEGYCEWINNKTFAMQVGCGINDQQYAFAYAKAGKKSIISCGVVLDGRQPLLLKM